VLVDDESMVTFAGKNQTLYAQWTTSPKTVKFNLNGGSHAGATKLADRKIEWGKAYGEGGVSLPEPAPPVHDPALEFVGWYTSKTGGAEITDVSVVSFKTSSQTLYARWDVA